MAVDQPSKVFSALADPTRRDMVARLAVGDATVNDLAEPYDVTVQAVSKHLKVLEDAGLVRKWIQRYRREAEDRYQRLDAVLQQMEQTDTRNVDGAGAAS